MVMMRNRVGSVLEEPPTATGDLLEVDGLTVSFHTREGVVRAVSDVSFSLARGERLAIVGESGSGKSVMSMSLMQMVARGGTIDGGQVVLNGRNVLGLSNEKLRSVRGGEVAMVFQDPTTSLNPVMRVRDQMIRPMRQHLGLSSGAARERAISLLAGTGIPDPERNVDAYPHQLSGGMRQRVMIAMAISCKPSLLIADEPTTALDVTIQAQIVALLKRISDEQGSSVIFVTHDMGLVARFAHRVAVMYAGRIVEIGGVDELFANPQHPYTKGLLGSIPSIEGELPERLTQIPGLPPNLVTLGAGCPFAARCTEAVELSTEERPLLKEVQPGHSVACWVAQADAGAASTPIRLGRTIDLSETAGVG